MGGIGDELVSRAAAPVKKKKENEKRVAFAPWRSGSPRNLFRGAAICAMTVAACLALAIGLFSMRNMMFPPDGSTGGLSASAAGSGNGAVGKPPLKISEEGPASEACYIDPDEWRGLPTENYTLEEQTADGVTVDRVVFKTLQDLADYADAFILVPNVHETSPDGDNAQVAIAEYAESIGDRIQTRQWDDYTVSTGSRILIRQTLIGGCMTDEPNNLLRVGGVYLLPIRFNSYWGAYEVVGDLDALFELNDEGKIVSRSRFPELSRYDGKPFSALLDDVRALYPAPDSDFTEQPIESVEQAESQINAAYINSGYRKFSARFEKETVIKGADVYLFKVTFGEGAYEYGAIAKLNGAFIRGDLDDKGEMRILGGLGSFPKKTDR
jgi:hypothetical protein